MQPLHDEEVPDDDPFYALSQRADTEGEALTNEEMDETIYGE